MGVLCFKPADEDGSGPSIAYYPKSESAAWWIDHLKERWSGKDGMDFVAVRPVRPADPDSLTTLLRKTNAKVVSSLIRSCDSYGSINCDWKKTDYVGVGVKRVVLTNTAYFRNGLAPMEVMVRYRTTTMGEYVLGYPTITASAYAPTKEAKDAVIDQWASTTFAQPGPKDEWTQAGNNLQILAYAIEVACGYAEPPEAYGASYAPPQQ